MLAKSWASTRFSTLTEINTQTVKNLKIAWTFSTGLTRGHEAAPLLVNSTNNNLLAFPYLNGYSLKALKRLLASTGFETIAAFATSLLTPPYP